VCGSAAGRPRLPVIRLRDDLEALLTPDGGEPCGRLGPGAGTGAVAAVVAVARGLHVLAEEGAERRETSDDDADVDVQGRPERDQSEGGGGVDNAQLNLDVSCQRKGNVDEPEHENGVDTDLHLGAELQLIDEGERQCEDCLYQLLVVLSGGYSVPEKGTRHTHDVANNVESPRDTEGSGVVLPGTFWECGIQHVPEQRND